MKNNFLRKTLLVVPIIAVVIAFLCSALFINPVKADVGYFSGSGTEESPYSISSFGDLQRLASDVNGGIDYSGYYFVLTNDIDCEDATLCPIGKEGKPFCGNFNGSGYVISNLIIDSTSTLKLGLFGYVQNGELSGIGIENITIEAEDLYSDDETYVAVGGLAGEVVSTSIRQCYVNNTTAEVDFSSTVNTYAGGLIGQMSISQVEDCYTNVDIDFKSNSTHRAEHYIAGIVGYADFPVIEHVYASGNLKSTNLVETNLEVFQNIGGLVGYVSNSNSELKDSFYVGNINTDFVSSSDIYRRGGLIGYIIANKSFTPVKSNINYCHYLSNVSTNYGIEAFGSNMFYSTDDLMITTKDDVTFFQNLNNFVESSNFGEDFDFDDVWLIETGCPTLQAFAYYEIEIEQVDNATTTIVGGEEISENVRKFKAGTQVEIVATIDSEVSKFYHIDNWRHGQQELGYKDSSYKFICSYSTQGKYQVRLKENTFTLKIEIPAEFTSIASLTYESTPVGYSINRQLLYGREIVIEAVLGTTDEAQNYAFDGWYSGTGESAKRIDCETGRLTFSIGDSLVPFDDDLSIVLYPKFTRDMCRLTIEFDNKMGEIKLYETEGFVDSISNERIKKGQKIDIVAQAKEGYEFLGWYRDKGDLDAISTKATLEDYSIANDTQGLYAKFKATDDQDEANKGLSGWAIFGIAGGSVVGVGLIVLIIVLAVKKKGSYKSNWNF